MPSEKRHSSGQPIVGKSRLLYATPWFKVLSRSVRFFPQSQRETYYVVCPSDHVNVLGMTREGHVLLVRQFRPAVQAFTLEFPSGHIDAGEKPREAAKRELFEETGRRASTLQFMGKVMPDTGRMTNTLWCYLATGVTPQAPSGWSPERGMDVLAVPGRHLLNYMAQGKIRHAHDMAALALALSKVGGKLFHEKV